ncbi:hypothetical protein D3C87_1764420 [compost metagenome]
MKGRSNVAIPSEELPLNRSTFAFLGLFATGDSKMRFWETGLFSSVKKMPSRSLLNRCSKYPGLPLSGLEKRTLDSGN